MAGAHPRPLPNRPDGTIDLEQIKHCIREDDAHFPKTRMIALETTHNRKGGQVLSLEYIDAVAAIARDNNLKLHMDGTHRFRAWSGWLAVTTVRMPQALASSTLRRRWVYQ